MDQKGTTALWHRAIKEYKEKLSPEDLSVILSLTKPKELSRHFQSSDNQTYQVQSRLQKIESGIEKYSLFLSVFSSTLPETSALFWGSLDLIRQVRDIHTYGIILTLTVLPSYHPARMCRTS